MFEKENNCQTAGVSETTYNMSVALDRPFQEEFEENGDKDNGPGRKRVSVVSKLWSIGTLSYTSNGLVILFFWLLCGDFAWSMKERAIGPMLQIQLKKFDASDFLAGFFMTALPQIIALILGPVISCWSDRCRSRWGRRIPFLLIPTPFTVFAIWGLAFSPVAGKALHEILGLNVLSLNMVIVIMLGLSWTVYEFASTISTTVFNGLITDVVPHPVIGRFYGLFRAISLTAGIIFNYFLIGAEASYMLIFIGLGSFYGIGATAMCLKVKEGDYPMSRPLDGASGWHPLKSVKSYFKECFSLSYYNQLFIMISMMTFGTMAVFVFSVYAAQSFGLSMSQYGLCIAITYACSLVLSYPIGILADRFHPLRVGLVMLALYVITVLAGFLSINSAIGFSVFYIMQGVIAGAYGTSMAGLPAMLFPKDKFSQFSSAIGLVTSIGIIVLGPAIGILLDCNGHQYQYTFGIAAVFSFCSLIAGLSVYKKFIRLGGVKNYIPPEYKA